MKKIVLSLAAATLLPACHDKSTDGKTVVTQKRETAGQVSNTMSSSETHQTVEPFSMDEYIRSMDKKLEQNEKITRLTAEMVQLGDHFMQRFTDEKGYKGVQQRANGVTHNIYAVENLDSEGLHGFSRDDIGEVYYLFEDTKHGKGKPAGFREVPSGKIWLYSEMNLDQKIGFLEEVKNLLSLMLNGAKKSDGIIDDHSEFRPDERKRPEEEKNEKDFLKPGDPIPDNANKFLKRYEK